MRVGLRVDVDTFRGTRRGVPELCELFAAHGFAASFFFSIGPDNMGRHLWRLVRPSFLWKMLRSNAPGLYGWDILLRGTLWPGVQIGTRLAPIIRRTAEAGHEVGLHAWDHHAWQARLEHWAEEKIRRHYARGFGVLSEILGRQPVCSAAPAWRCNARSLAIVDEYAVLYNSDCRGSSIFLPVDPRGVMLRRPQIPVTLPTFDEMVGREGITALGYYRELLELLHPSRLNVLAVHAEVEGLSQLQNFGAFLAQAKTSGWSFVPVGDLLDDSTRLPPGRIVKGTVAGRSGWVSCQEETDHCR